MENKRHKIKISFISLLILCSLFGVYKIWTIIPDYSSRQTAGLPSCPEPVRDICTVSQNDAFYLYSHSLDHPELLDEIDYMKVDDISALMESYGLTEDKDREYILAAASASGCGHSILAEIIINLYQDKPDLFEEEYGYPLYYERDGDIDYNSETLFTDIFLRINKNRLKEIHYDTYDSQYVMTMLGINVYGTDIKFDDMPEYLSSVVGEKTETAAFKRNVSYNKYMDYMVKKGFDYACIGVHKFVLVPYGSNPCKRNYTSDGGHWMRITGVTEDKHFIVSSWGDEWELLENDPYVKDKILFFPSFSKNDGGLVFLNVVD